MTAFCFGVAPLALYGVLALANIDLLLPRDRSCNLLALGLLALLILSIRNAWDLVTWIAPRRDKSLEGAP